MIEHLKDVKKVLDAHDIPFWLEHGSLLGAVREGKMIAGDDDIDLATRFQPIIDNIETISTELYKLGYDVYVTDVKITLKKDGKNLSIFLYRENIIPEHLHRYRVSKKDFRAHILLYGFLEGLTTQYRDYIHTFTPKTRLIYLFKRFMMSLPAKKNLWNLIVAFGKKIDCLYTFDIAFPSEYVDSLKSTTFHDMKVNIPVESEKYLAWMYGKDWKTPNPDYHRRVDFDRDMESYNIKRDLLYHLKILVDLLNKHNINFWMYGGALLGYVKNGELIPWDRDIDLFVWTHDYPQVLKLKKELKKLGFKPSIREKCVMLCWEDKNITIAHYKYYKTFSMEHHNVGAFAITDKLCTRNKIGNLIYFGVLCKAVEYNMRNSYLFLKWFLLKIGGCYLVRQIVPAHFYLDLKEIDLFGIKLKVPADTEGYFDYTFGQQWKEPIHEYFQYTSEYIKILEGKKPKSLKYHSNSIRS